MSLRVTLLCAIGAIQVGAAKATWAKLHKFLKLSNGKIAVFDFGEITVDEEAEEPNFLIVKFREVPLFVVGEVAVSLEAAGLEHWIDPYFLKDLAKNQVKESAHERT